MREVFNQLRRLHPVEQFAVAVVLAILLLTLLGQAVAPYSPVTPYSLERLLAPGHGHLLGTDENGMDILSRILTAPRTDVLIAVVATMFSVAVGVPLGVLVGFFEGSRSRLAAGVSEAVLRLLDVIQAFPVFVLAMVLVVALRGAGVFNIVAAIAFVNVPVFIRLIRAEVLSLRERPYAEAARVAGNSDLQVAFRHLLPNALPSAIVQISVTLGFAILLTASLSFVGAGVAAPTPELGSMISSGSRYMVLGQWWPSLFPGIALGITVFSFATVGQAIGRLLEEGVGEGAIDSISPTSPLSRSSFGRARTPNIAAITHTVEANTQSRVDSREVRIPSGSNIASEGGLLTVSELSIRLRIARRSVVLLDHVSFNVLPGEVLGVVGESGSGKSLLVRALLRLLPEGMTAEGGDIQFSGHNLLRLPTKELRELRGTQITHILPDPKSQLNPVLRIETVMQAVIGAHEHVSRSEMRNRSLTALRMVSIPDPERCLAAYPHELSGGMAQRVCIALALIINKPILNVADEPTFGLDVTVQRQVLDLMAKLARSRKTAQVIVTRDLGIVAHYCDRVAVMQGGRIVEVAPTRRLFEAPVHPHTQQLLKAVGARQVGMRALDMRS